MPARRSFYMRASRRLVRTIAPNRQTLVLIRSAAKGMRNAGGALMAGWDGWTASLRRRPAEADPPGTYPVVDLRVDDPIPAIMSVDDFPRLVGFFAARKVGEEALVSADTQALLYLLVRNLRPDHVVEIGTYHASTSKALCRALHANGHGLMHTVDPFNSGTILRILRGWPAALRDRLCYYPATSMDFFPLALSEGLAADLVFVDGNHDYEAALFDIQCAARILRPGGFIAIDNISQGGPFYAARDFLRAHPEWRECGSALEAPNRGIAFDRGRSTIAGTDLCVIRAPSAHVIENRPLTGGPQPVVQTEIGGVLLDLARPATGTLRAQYVVRVLEPQLSEETIDISIELRDAVGSTRVSLPWVFKPHEVPLDRTIELWLCWLGKSPLELREPPALF